jgi:hypothetical protein
LEKGGQFQLIVSPGKRHDMDNQALARFLEG